jgi:hypothetical protein
MLRRSLIVVHRWLGVSLCMLFLLWFPSGIAMMYWDYPSVSAADRLERSPALTPSSIMLSPTDAFARLDVTDPPAQVRLNTFDGRPVYRFRYGDGDAVIYADTGEEQVDVSRSMVDRIAAAWTRQPLAAARVRLLDAVDQWTVQGQFPGLNPLWKYSWPNGEQVYVSQATGEVVQYTTTASRLGAYVGAIPHWLYFTPLRQRGETWSRIVIWSSGLGTLAAILGIVIGTWMYSPSKRYRRDGAPTSIPYRGQKRWHAVLGLIFGVAAATWAFSGMLSMDPFPASTGGQALAPRPGGAQAIPQALRGRLDLASFSVKAPREALAQLVGAVPVKELELSSFAGEPIYLARLADRSTRVVPLRGEPAAGIDRERIVDVVTAQAGTAGLKEIRVLEQYDAYYLDRRRQLPLPVILARLNDAEQTRYYIDPKTGRVVGNYSAANWVSRWLYHGLHSFDFPWLYNHRPLWDIVVITFMVGGTTLCVTSLILAWRVLGRTLVRVHGARTATNAPLGDDLA